MKKLLIVLMLIGMIVPACAWDIVNGTANLTEKELLDAILTGRAAGSGNIHGVFAKSLYDENRLDYGTYWGYMNDNNDAIRLYNAMLEDHFNASVVASWKISEFAI